MSDDNVYCPDCGHILLEECENGCGTLFCDICYIFCEVDEDGIAYIDRMHKKLVENYKNMDVVDQSEPNKIDNSDTDEPDPDDRCPDCHHILLSECENGCGTLHCDNCGLYSWVDEDRNVYGDSDHLERCNLEKCAT